MKYWTSTGEEPRVLTHGFWFAAKHYTLIDLFERTEIALGIFPIKKFKLHFYPTTQKVQLVYSARYGEEFDGATFMSKSTLQAWFSLEELTPQIFVHEIAHLLLQSVLPDTHSIGKRAHEIMAQWAEKEIF